MNDEITKVLQDEHLTWKPLKQHRKVYFQELFNSCDAKVMGVRVSFILREKIEVGGAVLPHYHDVAEIIHITLGRVKLLYNGTYETFKKGDTFFIPARSIHSVVNDDCKPTEQLSLFLPVSNVADNTKNANGRNFNTYLV